LKQSWISGGHPLPDSIDEPELANLSKFH
jgi:hypothetical protein